MIVKKSCRHKLRTFSAKKFQTEKQASQTFCFLDVQSRLPCANHTLKCNSMGQIQYVHLTLKGLAYQCSEGDVEEARLMFSAPK